MMTCETCRCQNVCIERRDDGDGADYCVNYVPESPLSDNEEIERLRKENFSLKWDVDKLKKLFIRTSPEYERYCRDVAVLTATNRTVERITKDVKEAAIGHLTFGERYLCIKESDIDRIAERMKQDVGI